MKKERESIAPPAAAFAKVVMSSHATESSGMLDMVAPPSRDALLPPSRAMNDFSPSQ